MEPVEGDRRVDTGPAVKSTTHLNEMRVQRLFSVYLLTDDKTRQYNFTLSIYP